MAEPHENIQLFWAGTTCFKNEQIIGDGRKTWVTTHGLRGTLGTFFFEAVHADYLVSLRTAHRDPRSLQSYQHPRGAEGRQHQCEILGEPVPKRIRQDDDESGIDPPPAGNHSSAHEATVDGQGIVFGQVDSMVGNTFNITVIMTRNER